MKVREGNFPAPQLLPQRQCGWGPMQPWKPANKAAKTGPGEFIEILHLSDAQIRDTLILDRSKYRLNDVILTNTLRYELIEDLDSLLLAAILGAGLVLDALQDEALIYAWHDAGAGKNKEPQYSRRMYESKSFPKSINFASPCPSPQAALGSTNLVETISAERNRLFKELDGAWQHIIPRPLAASQARE